VTEHALDLGGGLPPTGDDADGMTVLDEDAGTVDAATMLDEITAEITAEVKPADIVLRVDLRPRYSVRFRTDLSDADLDAATTAAKRKRRTKLSAGQHDRSDVSELKVAALLLHKYCTGIYRDGLQVLDGAGAPLTFRSIEFAGMTQVPLPEAWRGVIKFYGAEGHVVAAGRALTAASGWADDATEADQAAGPTEPLPGD
jgi:hypothetical protein